MKEKMWAQVLYAPGDLRYEQIDVPTPGEGELLVQVKAALTCGTDVKTYKRGHPKVNNYPLPFGHEFTGVVAAVGPGVTKFKVGDRVGGYNSVPCFNCFFCKKNEFSLCQNLSFLYGGYAEYVVIPKRLAQYNYHVLPDNLDYFSAALLEPLACAVHGISRIPVKLNNTVVVIGAGPIGLFFVKLASLMGTTVISVDLSDLRLEQSYKFGASASVNASSPEHIDTVKAMTPNGYGADVVIEATGFTDAWENAVQMVRPGGSVLMFGGPRAGSTITLDCQKLHYEEIQIRTVFHSTPKHVREALDLLASGKVDGSQFISAYYPLSQARQALEDMGAQKGIKFGITFDNL
jgi:L-iditol 2-dehydrogenase